MTLPHDGAPDADALALIVELGLAPHPEGGFYRETFRAPLCITTPKGERSASTAIYFLLPTGAFSAVHRICFDEVWHHYAGDPLELHTIDDHGAHRVRRLGRNWAGGEQQQAVVQGGTWQAAIPVGKQFALCGCTVAPGFDFADFEMPTRAQLTRRFPQHEALLVRLTRS